MSWIKEHKKEIFVGSVAVFTLLTVILSAYGVISMKEKSKEVVGIEHTEDYIEFDDEEPLEESVNAIVEEKVQDEPKKDNKKQDKKNTDKKKTENVDPHPYYIKINVQANVVTVYKKDANGAYTVPVKAIVCSTGSATPRSGKYSLHGKKRRWANLNGGVYGQYTTNIVGGILFHSVPYAVKGDPASLIGRYYDKLGTRASAGCIRLTTIDAMWIYNNISAGTTVEFYSSSNPGPLGKPSARKIVGSKYPNWDPTDPDSRNPWKKEDLQAPTANVTYSITGKTNQNVVATIRANEPIQGVNGWTLSQDKLILTKTYSVNATENVTIMDLAGNKTVVTVKIDNIDKTAPIVEVLYSTTSTTDKVTVTLKANEQIENLSGWSLSNDKLKLTKTYTNNKTETFTVKDIAGNAATVQVKVTNISNTPNTNTVITNTIINP